MPAADRIVEESTSSSLDGRQRAGARSWRRELVKLVGCCWLTCSPQTSDSGNSVALYPNARWIAMGGDGAPGRGKKKIRCSIRINPVSSGRSRKQMSSSPLLFVEQEISIKEGSNSRRQRRGLSGSKFSRGVPGRTVLPNVVSRCAPRGLRRAGNSGFDRDTFACLSSVLRPRAERWTICGWMNPACAW